MVNTYRNRRRQPWWRRRQELTDPILEKARVDDPSHRYDARRWLSRAFQALTPAQRALVSLHEIEGWSIGDLARLYQRPEGTIKARLSRARKLMRRTLERTPGAEDDTNESEATYAIPRKRPALE
jgi:RNA polymerase sigma-70 factor (ECF subfamily)